MPSYDSKGTLIHCAAKQVEDYLEAYATYFHLRPHFRLSTTVKSVSRDDEGEGRWRLDSKDGLVNGLIKLLWPLVPILNV